MRTVALLLLLLITSCKKEVTDPNDPIITPTTEESKSDKQCYVYVNMKDTIRLTIQERDNHASGRLEFKNFEKDQSDGTLSGTFLGDTLFADYTFRSEGLMSVREMAFLKQRGTLLIGVGEMKMSGNKEVFADTKAVRFDSNMILKRTGCK